MSLPELAKSWQFDINQVYAFQGDPMALFRSVLRGIKESLVTRLGSRAEITSPWVVTESCNSDAVSEGDLWLDDSDLVWGGSTEPRSWIVLGQPSLGSESQICIELVNAVDVVIVWAPDGFPSNGSVGGRPTATTEVLLSNMSGGAPPSDVVIHVMQSTDGQCTRAVVYSQNQPGMFWLFDRARNPVANWDIPAVLLISGGGAIGALSYAALQSIPRAKGYGTAPMEIYMSTESFGSPVASVGAKFVGANAFDGNWPLTPIGLASLTEGHRGRHGELFDLWFASAGANHGDVYPGDGTRQFVQFGHLVFPWDGTPYQAGSIPRTS